METELTNRYVGTHNSAIMNAYLGQSAAGVTWPVAWKAFQQANPKEAAELYVIWQTPTLIQNAIVVRNDVPADLAEKSRQLLTRPARHTSRAGHPRPHRHVKLRGGGRPALRCRPRVREGVQDPGKEGKMNAALTRVTRYFAGSVRRQLIWGGHEAV